MARFIDKAISGTLNNTVIPALQEQVPNLIEGAVEGLASGLNKATMGETLQMPMLDANPAAKKELYTMIGDQIVDMVKGGETANPMAAATDIIYSQQTQIQNLTDQLEKEVQMMSQVVQKEVPMSKTLSLGEQAGILSALPAIADQFRQSVQHIKDIKEDKREARFNNNSKFVQNLKQRVMPYRFSF